ncbi:ribbon-helix-helix protein, CopG family [Oxynema aestuarii]|jgi:antitoxin component of RelBE/YafQ-DinJ toxin-antitoxin module|uniref:Ribbon-helix-helix protein, CopG family n=1 Tax=Oxynema aestuarii AP17 TaxID=2064643 RepID=A0A6H1TXY8_9CYAN|nr:ribbon-helix-helix protein, CopG family [Oxynema aestuarii]QIZ70633.1 ribbon-helix-helix protein, CopG family [Oxynema aestuarii AP17]
MARDELLQIRLTAQEKERLQAEADRRGVSMSEVIRDYIKRLPKQKA